MKLNYRRTILIGLAFLSISAFWQTYDNIIPLMLQNTFGLKETVTGSLMAMDNVLALFLLPLLGSISDRVDTKLGRRMPFIAAGTVLAVSFYILIALADRAASLPLFLAVLFGALVSMGLYRSPAVALMPDLTPNVLRSKANAVINLMGTVGAVYALVMIRLLSGRTLSHAGRTDYLPLFASVALLMVLAVAVLLLTVRERRVKQQVNEEIRIYRQAHPEDTEIQNIGDAGPAESKTPPLQSAGENRANARPAAAMPADVKRSMIFLLISIFLWFTAYNAVTTAFSRYAENVWQMRNGGYASCLLVATLAAVASYIPIGHISSRIGRKRTILVGIVLMLLCYMTAAFVTEYAFWLNFLFGLIGIGWAAINVNSYPMVVEMSRGAEIGKFTGTYYTFSMAAQIFTPVFSGFLLEHVSYRTLFPYALLFSALALLTMTQVRHGDIRPAKKGSALESFDVDD